MRVTNVETCRIWLDVHIINGVYKKLEVINEKLMLGRKGINTMNIREEIVAYARKFEGNPYVYGGTSLTKGVDCSGFAQAVFKAKGIKLPRTSRMQAAGGKEIAMDHIKPADLIFYAKDKRINHVAIYLGDGKVISASSKKTGIRITDYNYREPIKAVNYID